MNQQQGVDPTPEQWRAIADVCADRDAIIIFDTAYQVESSLPATQKALFRNDTGFIKSGSSQT